MYDPPLAKGQSVLDGNRHQIMTYGSCGNFLCSDSDLRLGPGTEMETVADKYTAEKPENN